MTEDFEMDPTAASVEAAYAAPEPASNNPMDAAQVVENIGCKNCAYSTDGTVVTLRNPIEDERIVFVARPTAGQVRDYAKAANDLDAFDASTAAIVALTYLDEDQVEGLDARDFNTLANTANIFMEGAD